MLKGLEPQKSFTNYEIMLRIYLKNGSSSNCPNIELPNMVIMKSIDDQIGTKFKEKRTKNSRIFKRKQQWLPTTAHASE